MKLSFKFFCIAYVTVLVFMSFGGAFLIQNATNMLWNTQVERVQSAENYAVDSFYSLAELSTNQISKSQLTAITGQIKNTLDHFITEITITQPETFEQPKTPQNNEISEHFIRKDQHLILESVCRLSTSTQVYCITLHSDFTELEQYSHELWFGYGMIIFVLAVFSGLLLFFMAKRITRPLKELTKAANSIVSGNYGKTVPIKSRDAEICELANSFNSMSVTVDRQMTEIKDEAKKRDRFVADFTHEMKTPMTAIIGYAQLLNSYGLNAAESKQAAAAIYHEGKRLEQLSLQLLDLYLFQHETVVLEPVFLRAVGKQLETTLKFMAEKYQVSFRVDFEDVTVLANRMLLLSMLYNLADNAFKASCAGEMIYIYSCVFPEKVQIFVKDTGRGIAPESIAHLTEPFFREDKVRSRKLGGAGLGLSLCKEIAAQHGTTLCFKSEVGKGTTVFFTLKRGGDENAAN